MITIWKLAPAIATGNALIIKSPELCPLYAQKLALLVKEAGFPPGVVNVVPGLGHQAGQAIADHMAIKKVAFTGSAATGRAVLGASARSNLKKGNAALKNYFRNPPQFWLTDVLVTLELGGKGPSIVFGDADMDTAVKWTSIGITANNGQICAAGSRIYVHSSIYESFLEKFTQASANAIHGDPLIAETTKGPIISKQQHAKILNYIQEGKTSGARLLHGGQNLDGNYVPNTAFADVADDAVIMREEIFGPVAVRYTIKLYHSIQMLTAEQAITKFDSEAEVISKANDSELGLAAAVFTNDVSRAHRVAAAIEVGQVTVNSWGTLNANTPFGGVKQSGFGRDLGQEALDSWTVTKVVKVNILPSREGAVPSRL